MHYFVIVIGNGAIDEMMAPFDENLEVSEYCIGPVSERSKQSMLGYYAKQGHVFKTFDSCYKKFGEDWNGNRFRKVDGTWMDFSTYNPEGMWDWYVIGGRWAGQLSLKEGAKPILGVNFHWGVSEETKRSSLAEHPNNCDSAYLKDIDNLDSLKPWGILKDGEWFEVDGEENITEYVKDLPGDTILTCVDMHS